MYYNCITCPILCKIECIDLECNKFVLVLVQVELIQFECSICIRSIWAKTNTNLLHSNSIHSISRKNWTISRKSDTWYKLYYINLYLKRALKKFLKSKKNWSQNNPPKNNVVPVPAKSQITCCPFGGNWLHIIFRRIVLKTTAQLEKCSSSPRVASVCVSLSVFLSVSKG